MTVSSILSVVSYMENHINDTAILQWLGPANVHARGRLLPLQQRIDPVMVSSFFDWLIWTILSSPKE